MKVPVRTAQAACFALGIVLALGIGACMRMDVLPKADAGSTMNLTEPRPYDVATGRLDRDPTKIYRIGPQDVVRVDVRKDPTISGEFTVTAEGNILIPNIDSIHVADLTSDEVEQELNQVLEKYIREPDVKVGIKEYKSKVIYVVGQVNRPGPQVMQADQMTVEQAIFGAGLPARDAAMQRTLVVRPSLNKPIVWEIDLADIIYKGKMRENLLLEPNDRVYVPSRYSSNLRAAVRDLLGPIEDFNRARSTSYIGSY